MKNDLSISEIQKYQKQIWEKNKDRWTPMKPEYAKDFILYMIEEIGETIAIIKKKGAKQIMDDPTVRERFIEEMSDVLMYYADVLNRFDISAEELSKIYLKKCQINLKRDFEKDHKKAK